MTNEEAAHGIAAIIKEPLLEFIAEIIETRCYLVILKLLKEIRKKENSTDD